MQPQELVFIVGNAAFFAALLPIILDRTAAVPRSSSGLTGAVLWAYTITFATLDLWVSALATLFTAVCWTLIFLLRPIPKTSKVNL